MDSFHTRNGYHTILGMVIITSDGDHHRDGNRPRDSGHPKDVYNPMG